MCWCSYRTTLLAEARVECVLFLKWLFCFCSPPSPLPPSIYMCCLLSRPCALFSHAHPPPRPVLLRTARSLHVGDDQDTQHEAHSIKGAAANLMCHRLRLAALYMERAGQVGTRLQEGGSRMDLKGHCSVASGCSYTPNCTKCTCFYGVYPNHNAWRQPSLGCFFIQKWARICGHVRSLSHFSILKTKHHPLSLWAETFGKRCSQPSTRFVCPWPPSIFSPTPHNGRYP